MKVTTEQPDIVLHGRQFYHDTLKITVREKEVVFVALIDGAGCEFTIGKDEFLAKVR